MDTDVFPVVALLHTKPTNDWKYICVHGLLAGRLDISTTIALTFNFRNSVIHDQFKATWYFNVQGCHNLNCIVLFLFPAGKYYH